MTECLELREVCKSFGSFVAVDELSMAVRPGTVAGLLGENGAGKTTTIRMIMDIIAPDRGEVLLFGRPRRDGDLRRIGYLPEERGLYRKMSVGEQLTFLGELAGLRRRDAQVRCGRWLERFELASWAKSKVEELSKGMQQKIQIAGALLHDPEIVILDEPFSGLDPINQGLLRQVLAELKALGKAILFSTHVMEHAEKLCDEVTILAHGKVALAGNLAALRRERGGNSYRVRGTGDLTKLGALPGVLSAVPRDGILHLRLADDTDPAAVLRQAVAMTSIVEFRSEEPDLETLFVEAVRHATS